MTSNPDSVRVELFANPVNGGEPVREEMKRADAQTGSSGGRVYHATVSAARPASDYTVRVMPQRRGRPSRWNRPGFSGSDDEKSAALRRSA